MADFQAVETSVNTYFRRIVNFFTFAPLAAIPKAVEIIVLKWLNHHTSSASFSYLQGTMNSVSG
jgi:hypothetical protein